MNFSLTSATTWLRSLFYMHQNLQNVRKSRNAMCVLTIVFNNYNIEK